MFADEDDKNNEAFIYIGADGQQRAIANVTQYNHGGRDSEASLARDYTM